MRGGSRLAVRTDFVSLLLGSRQILPGLLLNSALAVLRRFSASCKLLENHRATTLQDSTQKPT